MVEPSALESKETRSDETRPLSVKDDAESGIRALLESGRHSEAFDQMVTMYQNRMYRVTYSMTHDVALAQDLAQETFIRAWRALPRFEGRSSVSTWLCTIARHACLSHRRSMASRPLMADEMGDVADTRVSGGENPAADVGLYVARLPEKYRQVIALYYLEEKSYEETAAALEIPLGTVKTLLHRAKKELARMMQKEE